MRAPGIQMVPNAMPSGGAPTLRVAKPGGFDALQQGAAAIGQAADRIQAGYEKEQHEAAVVEARDSLTAYQHETTDTLHGSSTVTPGAAADAAFAGREARTGFLATRGKAAAETSADTLDELEQKRQKRAEKIANEKARELFLQSSAESYENTRRTVESHVSSEIERAKVDSIAAASDEALRAVSLDPGNDKLAAERIASVVGPLSSLGRGQDFNDKEALKVQQQVAAARLDALLSAGDIGTAERVMDANKFQLGTHLDTYRTAIGKAKAAGVADGVASRIVAGATNDRGDIDQARALKALNELPPTEQAKVRPVLFQRMTEQEQAYAADTKRISTAAHTVFNRVGWSKFAGTQLATDLNDRNPELYDRLKNEGRMEWERIKRAQRDTKEDRRAQQNIDTIALNQFLSLTPEERSETDTEMWAKGRGMTDVAKSSLGKLKESARQVVERGQAASENEFVKRAIADAEGTLPVGTDAKTKGKRKAQEIAIEAEARRWYSQWVTEHEGKAPTDADIAEKSGKMTAGRVPVGDTGASQQADVLIRQGTQKVQVMPDIPQAKPSKRDRALALKALGKSNAEIAKTMNDEGY